MITLRAAHTDRADVAGRLVTLAARCFLRRFDVAAFPSPESVHGPRFAVVMTSRRTAGPGQCHCGRAGLTRASVSTPGYGEADVLRMSTRNRLHSAIA
jgi:hypothetical protein